MAMWHSFKPERLLINDQSFEVVKDSGMVAYFPDGRMLMFEVNYFTGSQKTVLGFPVREKGSFKVKLKFGEYEIKINEQGDEQTKQIKNLGYGALIGAAAAGPLGAAVGAYIGSKSKECPAIIIIPRLKIKLEALAPIGYLKEKSKNDFFSE